MPAQRGTSATTASQSRGAAAAVTLLRRRSSYPEFPGVVEPIETHRSWLFLTDRFAYRLKKPGPSETLDLSSSQQRQRACQNELRVNRRWAPDVYLTVLPITRSPRGQLQLNGRGTPVDWVVKMRRLPPERSLQRLLVNRQLTPPDLEAAAAQLADHYSRQPPLTVQPDSYRRQLAQRVRTNLNDLLVRLPAWASTIDQVHLGQLRQLTLHACLFDRRVCDGRVIDGHGDLRPHHVYVLSRLVVIDRLTSACQLRQVDIAEDLSLLVMECEQLGLDDVGQALLQHYASRTGDHPPASLLAFYKSCCACLRASVLARRATQENELERASDLALAEAYLRQAAGYLQRQGE